MILMSWKSIELQVALPRTQEAGKFQDQLSKQNQRFQESLAQSQLRQQELERNRTNRFEKTTHKKVTDEEETDENNPQDHNEAEEKQERKEKLVHPYLGRQVDITR